MYDCTNTANDSISKYGAKVLQCHYSAKKKERIMTLSALSWHHRQRGRTVGQVLVGV